MQVRIITQQPGKALIEWNDSEGLHRGVIPDELLEGQDVCDACLSAAIPYGIDWEFELSNLKPVSASDIAQSLYRHGLYSYQDIIKNPSMVQAALYDAYGVEINTIMRIAQQSIRGGNNG